MKILKSLKNSESYYLISSGLWSVVVCAEDKSSALKLVFNDLKDNPNDYGDLGEVVCIMNIDRSMRDLTLEDSLKFTSTSDLLTEIYLDKPYGNEGEEI